MSILNFDNYKVKRFGEIYDVDNVMSTNDECWEEFYKAIGKDDKVIIDCLNVNLMRPWNNELFKRFLNEHLNVYFKIYNDEKLCNSINLACDLMGLSHRAIQERIISNTKVIDKEALRKEQELNEIISYFVSEDRKARFSISNYCDSIGSGSTLDKIAEAVNKYIKTHDVDKFDLDATNVYISSGLITRIIDIMKDLNLGTTEVKFISDDAELNKSIEMKEVYKKVDEVSNEEKLRVLNSLPMNYPCMLGRYKNNRAKDDFGRLGRGKFGSCRAAIIRKVDDEYVYLDEYNGNDFYTYEHISMERDGNVTPLKAINTRIKLHDIGYGNYFLGEKYHIMRAIQEDAGDSTQMYVPNSEGFSTAVNVTIPERMKMVFDSWDIKYDKDELNSCIRKTNETLGIKSKKIGE